MADKSPSSAQMFTSISSELDEGPGTNQFLRGASHDDQSTIGPRGNRVQDGALALLGTHSTLGSPTHNNPIGSQDG